MTNSIEKASGYLSPEIVEIEMTVKCAILQASTGSGTGEDGEIEIG